MDEDFESLYLLIILLILWGLSFMIGMIFKNELTMVLFFWVSLIIIVGIYAYVYKKRKTTLMSFKKQIFLSIPIWLFLVYQSYFTIRQTEMTNLERWALVPFVLGLGFYLAILKIDLEKKYKK